MQAYIPDPDIDTHDNTSYIPYLDTDTGTYSWSRYTCTSSIPDLDTEAAIRG
jgi:hypothetical protein